MSYHEDLIESVRNRNPERAAFFEQMFAKDRQRAFQKAATAPRTLTDYERRLIAYVDPPSPPPPPVPRPEVDVSVIRPSWLVFRNHELRALNDHAIEIARRYHLKTKACLHGQQRASQPTRTVCTPAVTNEETYCAFRHEAGHIVSPDGDSHQYRYEVVEDANHTCTASAGGEIGAWRWALDTAHVWTRGMQEEMASSLASYRSHANEDERESMALLVAEAAMRISDRPWTFAELDKAKDALRGPCTP